MSAESDGVSLWELFREAAESTFMEPGADGHKLVQAVFNQVERLPSNTIRGLLRDLRQTAAAVWRGEEAVSKELQALAVCV